MIPSLNVERMYHNGTSFTIIDNSCNNNVIPNRIILSVGFFKKDKIDIQINETTSITPYQFMNGNSLMINSLLLGLTKQDESFLEIESGIIELQYYCFFDTFINVEVNRNTIVLTVPHYTITSNYDYLLINDKAYYIDKSRCYGNVIILTTDTEMISSFHLYGGNLGINYVVHTNQIRNKLILLIGDNIVDLSNKNISSCSTKEQELRNNLVNYLLLWNSINVLKHRNKLLELNLVIETLKNYLFDINTDSITHKTEYHGNTCNFCN